MVGECNDQIGKEYRFDGVTSRRVHMYTKASHRQDSK
jgi:hypothetical protein